VSPLGGACAKSGAAMSNDSKMLTEKRFDFLDILAIRFLDRVEPPFGSDSRGG
jgi:hypothetical protein